MRKWIFHHSIISVFENVKSNFPYSFLSAVLILTAMLLLIGYREFDFLENIRMYRMGWRSRMHHNDIWRWPFYVTWCSFVICLFSFVTSMFANSIELKFAANCGYKTKCLSKKWYNNTNTERYFALTLTHLVIETLERSLKKRVKSSFEKNLD